MPQACMSGLAIVNLVQRSRHSSFTITKIVIGGIGLDQKSMSSKISLGHSASLQAEDSAINSVSMVK